MNAYLSPPFTGINHIFVYVKLKILENMPFVAPNRCFSGSEAVNSGLLLQRY